MSGPHPSDLITVGASSHASWRWWLWRLLPWRYVYSVELVLPSDVEGNLPWMQAEFSPDRRRALRKARRLVEKYGFGAGVTVCARIAPWRPGCAMREVAVSTWEGDWPWRVVAVVQTPRRR